MEKLVACLPARQVLDERGNYWFIIFFTLNRVLFLQANKLPAMLKPFYITTTLPYVNAEPHIGFAMEIIRADIIARYKKQQGHEVFFNTGTDEHGAKIWQKAKELGVPVQNYVDECAEKFKNLKDLLGLSSDLNFIRTTDPHHILSAQEFWKICNDRGYIYKKNYKIKYCVGCELEKTESELENGKCSIHPNLGLETIDEENYFFKFSDFQKPLLDLYAKNPDFVVPSFRFNEIKAFVERGLQDFSISRLKSKMSWGIEVPDDSEHVMYVWFDALVNYISAIGWPHDMKNFKKWAEETGGMVQYCGKDNLRQQSAMWQAMLMAVQLPPSKTIVIDGFITSGGQKMSKSLGNVINPVDLVKEYGMDALRYYVARELHPFEDSDFTTDGFKKAYNGNLANGLGNLTARVIQMAEQNGINVRDLRINNGNGDKRKKELEMVMGEYNLQKGMNIIWEVIAELDQRIQKDQPFKLVKTEPEKAKQIIVELVSELSGIADMLLPFMPETAEKIKKAIAENKKPDILFPRKE